MGNSEEAARWLKQARIVKLIILYMLEGILLTEDKDLEKVLRTIPETKTVTIWSWNKLISETMKKKK